MKKYEDYIMLVLGQGKNWVVIVMTPAPLVVTDIILVSIFPVVGKVHVYLSP